MRRPTWHVITALGLFAAALLVSACRDESTTSPPAVGGPQFSHLANNTDVDQDTWLNQTQQNDNFASDVVLDLRESAKNRLLIQFDGGAVQSAYDFVTATGGRILLRLTILDNPGDWGPVGRPVDVHRMIQGWDGNSATYNCAADADLTNNQADCEPGDGWDVKKNGINPWVTEPTASAIITTGLTGAVDFDVTADIVAFAEGTESNYGWVVKRQDEAEAGAIAFGSFESEFAPELDRSACPEGTICGETDVGINNQGTNGSPFSVAASGASGASGAVVVLDVAANQVVINGDPGDLEELIFAMVKLTDDNGSSLKCLGLEDPSLEVGDCWEARAIDPNTGGQFSITFNSPQRIAACVPAATGETRASDLLRLVRRQQTDRSRLNEPALPPEPPLQVLEPSSQELPLACDVQGGLGSLDTDSSPVLRWAGALWNKVKGRLSPRPLHAAAAVVVWDKETKTSEIGGLSFFSWAKLRAPYRAGGYAWVTVGKKTGQLPCDACDIDRAPRGWFEDAFDDSGWNRDDPNTMEVEDISKAAFGSVGPTVTTLSCPLDGTIVNTWPSADPRFNPPQITELLLRKRVFVDEPTNSHTGGITLQIRLAGRNDFRAYLNGTEVTEFVTQPSVDLKKSKGWIELTGGCPAYDEVIITVPESLIRFGQDNLLAVHARSSADEPSFADVQVNIDEAS